MDTLVLDSEGKPVSLMDWQDAVTLIWKDRCVVIKEDAEHILHSPSFEMGMPVVIQLRNSFAKRQRRQIPFSRRNVAIRDRSQCQYCRKVLQTQEYTYDHVLPRSRSGKSSFKNVVLSCVKCNFKKSNRTPEEAGMFLLNKPVQPDINDNRFTFRLRVRKMKPEWKDWQFWFCAEKASWEYWNTELEP